MVLRDLSQLRADTSQTTTRPFWFFCVLPAISVSLGWSLRGSIGGGPLGAVIPGAMIGLLLCLLLDQESEAGRVAALAAIGVGLGGQETYGQTVGLSYHPETFWWAIGGFAVKGSAWGLLGGAFIGIALRPPHLRRAVIGLALMVIGTWFGWTTINSPKLIYFSNRLDNPREELWAGLWLGGLLMLAWFRARVPSLFALYGAVGGGIGFAFGASLQPFGRVWWTSMPLGWWKCMELAFGALLGLAYGICAWRVRTRIAKTGSESPCLSAYWAAVYAMIAIGLGVVGDEILPVRFSYTVGGAVLASLVLISNPLAWQVAITSTYAAFTLALVENQNLFPAWMAWACVVVSTGIVAIIVGRNSRARPMFLFLTWAAVGTSFRYLLPPSKPGWTALTMLAIFVALAAAVTWGISACGQRDSVFTVPTD